MKVCTITCHDVYNFGASLQAFALQTHLNNAGHAVEIIDYKPDYLSQHFNLSCVANPIWDRNLLLRTIYLGAKLPGRLRSLKQKRAFDRFTRSRLHLTPHRYTSNNELRASPPQADAYICGSDQIWNAHFPNGQDPAFFLDFAPAGKRRIAYAASLGEDDLPESEIPHFLQRLQRIGSVSLREESAIPYLRKIGAGPLHHVMDPVFLLGAEEWTNHFNLTLHASNDYLLVYTFENTRSVDGQLRELASHLGCEIVSVGPGHCGAASKRLPYIGPGAFLDLVFNAKAVVSSSFHAIAFSIIFQKPFYTLLRSDGLNSRITNLLATLQVGDRTLQSQGDSSTTPIEFEAVSRVLLPLIEESANYLRAALGESQRV